MQEQFVLMIPGTTKAAWMNVLEGMSFRNKAQKIPTRTLKGIT